MSEIPKAYEPSSVESKWYQFWLDQGLFTADPASPKPPYSIVIPPPNVTGMLHMGHVLNNTIQDLLARKARMHGKEPDFPQIFPQLWKTSGEHYPMLVRGRTVAHGQARDNPRNNHCTSQP